MPRDNAFICRCEEVETATVQAAIAHGARTINDIKRRTRAGMGLCQGAYCIDALSWVLHESGGTALDAIVPMTVRPPLRAIGLDALADLD